MTLDHLVSLALAFVLGVPLGRIGEGRGGAPGLRTYSLLSLCVCSLLLVARDVARGAMEQADVMFGVLGAMSFVAWGAIMRSREHAGMTAAVSLWLTGAIGAGAALGAPFVSSALSLTSAVVLRLPSLVVRLRRRS